MKAEAPCLRRGWKRSEVNRTLVIEKGSLGTMDIRIAIKWTKDETERRQSVTVPVKTVLSHLQRMFPKLEITFKEKL